MIGRLSAGAAAVAVAAITAIAWASWTTPASAGSKGGAAAATVNQGATPSVSVTAIGREVAVGWGAATLSNGAPVGGYLVERPSPVEDAAGLDRAVEDVGEEFVDVGPNGCGTAADCDVVVEGLAGRGHLAVLRDADAADGSAGAGDKDRGLGGLVETDTF